MAPEAAKDGPEQPLEPGQGKDHECDGRPDPGRARQDRPAQKEKYQKRRRYEAAPEVVEQLPSLENRKGVTPLSSGTGHPSAQPGEKLPVAADPAMLPTDVSVIPRRKVVEELRVIEQTAPRVVAFDEVVAEDVVLRKGGSGRRLEGIDVVDTLAGEAADPKEIHVGVRSGRRI